MANHYPEIRAYLLSFTENISSVLLTDWKQTNSEIFGDPENVVFAGRETVSSMTTVGKLKSGGWKATIVVYLDANMMSFAVQLPRGRGSYRTDILARFATEDVIREYAEHALAQLLNKNNWKDTP